MALDFGWDPSLHRLQPATLNDSTPSRWSCHHSSPLRFHFFHLEDELQTKITAREIGLSQIDAYFTEGDGGGGTVKILLLMWI